MKLIKPDNYARFIGEHEDYPKGSLFFCVGSQLVQHDKDNPYLHMMTLFMHRLDDDGMVLYKEDPVRVDPTLFRKVGQMKQVELEKTNLSITGGSEQ